MKTVLDTVDLTKHADREGVREAAAGAAGPAARSWSSRCFDAAARGDDRLRGVGRGRQGRQHPAGDRVPRPARLQRDPDRRAQGRRGDAPLPVALLAAAPQGRPPRHLRPHLVRPRAGRARRGLLHRGGVAARLPGDQGVRALAARTTAPSSSSSGCTSRRRSSCAASRSASRSSTSSTRSPTRTGATARSGTSTGQAVVDMLTNTSTTYAPWTIVEANDKLWARVRTLQGDRGRHRAGAWNGARRGARREGKKEEGQESDGVTPGSDPRRAGLDGGPRAATSSRSRARASSRRGSPWSTAPSTASTPSCGEADAALTGKARHEAAARDRPAGGRRLGGDDGAAARAGPARSTRCCRAPRRSRARWPGTQHEEQVVAANIDVAFLVTSLNAELSPRRLERYLTLAWKSGARPVVVLTKADLVADPAALVREVEAVAAGVTVLLTSAKTGLGIEALRALPGGPQDRDGARLLRRGEVHADERPDRVGAAGHREDPRGRRPGPPHHHAPRAGP